jgi:hypothetical protein
MTATPPPPPHPFLGILSELNVYVFLITRISARSDGVKELVVSTLTVLTPKPRQGSRKHGDGFEYY